MKTLNEEVRIILNQIASGDHPPINKDYFSWGRDKRHIVDDTETLASLPIEHKKNKLIREIKGLLKLVKAPKSPMKTFERYYGPFETTYQLMSNSTSKQLFVELIVMSLVGEKKMSLSSFTDDFIRDYELSSDVVLKAQSSLKVYKWILKQVSILNPSISIYTTPIILALHKSNRLYRYQCHKEIVEVEKGDIIIDAGVGWGDTTVYLAAKAGKEGHSYAFDILKDGMNALNAQLELNKEQQNITPVLKALSDTSGDKVYISSPSPGARIEKKKTETAVYTITIDDYVTVEKIDRVDFIKMDIEGAEISAIKGAETTIRTFKPKLAISVYHKWDDLLTIPTLIQDFRDDYKFYLDCTTGFGGEAVLYAK